MITEWNEQLNASLLLLEIKQGSTAFVLATRNQRVAECVGTPYNAELLNSYDTHNKANNLQFYDVITNKIFNINPVTIVSCLHIGIPMTFSPGFLTSTHLPADERDIAFDVYFENMQPLLQKIKEFKALGIDDFGQVPCLNSTVFNLNKKLNDLSIVVPENNIYGFISFIAASNTLTQAFIRNYETLDYLPSVEHVFKDQNFLLEATTFSEFCDKINDSMFIKKIKDVYVSFLNKYRVEYITKIENDLTNIQQIVDNTKLSNTINITDLKAQLLLQLQQLKELNVEEDLKDIDSPYIVYKYWPFSNLPPDELGLSLPAFLRKDIILVKTLLKFTDIDHITNILINPAFYLDDLKKIREKQILTYRDNFVKEIEQDITSTTDEDEITDLKDIIKLLSDDSKLYKEELEAKTSMQELLEYWPTMLYPAPDFVYNYDQ